MELTPDERRWILIEVAKAVGVKKENTTMHRKGETDVEPPNRAAGR